jgi:hypothetical protein
MMAETDPMVVALAGGVSVGMTCMLTQSTVTKGVEAIADATAEACGSAVSAGRDDTMDGAADAASVATRSSVCWPQAASDRARVATAAVAMRVFFTPRA